MLVKCKICGTKTERKDAYKIVVNGKNNYYCNEEEYNSWIKKREIRDNTYILIYEVFGRKITNTILFKEVDELSNIYTFEKIYSYIKENQDYLYSVMKKINSKEYGKIRYFTAILKNNLGDYEYINETENIYMSSEVDIPKNKFKRSKKRKALIEYEMEERDEL